MKIIKGILAATLLSVPTITFAQNPAVGTVEYSNSLPMWIESNNDSIIVEIGNNSAVPISKDDEAYWQITIPPYITPNAGFRWSDPAASTYLDVVLGPTTTYGSVVYIRAKSTIDFPAASMFKLYLSVTPEEPGSGNNITVQANSEWPISENNINDDNVFEPVSVIDPMSVNWLYVQGKALEQTSVISWATSSEANCKGYELQSSTDGRIWSKVTFVNSKAENGNSETQLDYEGIDYAPAQGRNIYRVKQIDLDGSFAYSKDVVVNHANIKNNIVLYPNPATQSINVKGLSGHNTIEVVDVLGRKLISEARDGDNQVIDITRLAAGNYIVNIIDASNIVTSFKLVKE